MLPEELAPRCRELLLVHSSGEEESEMHRHSATGKPEITSFTVAFLVERRRLIHTHLYLDLNQSWGSSDTQKIECLVKTGEGVCV